MRRRIQLVITALVAATAAPLRAQDAGLEERFRMLAATNAELYVRPVSEGLGHALTAGFAETARTHRVFGFDLGLRVMAGLPAASARTFNVVLPATVEYRGITFPQPYAPQNGTGETPTAVGSGAGVVLTPNGVYRAALIAYGENPNDYNVQFPDGMDLPAVPFAVAEASIGLPFETELTLRLVPSVSTVADVGAISARGVGLKHTVTRWLPDAPIDVALFAGMQSLQVGEYLDASAHTFGVIASRSFGPLTAFGHVRSAGANVDVSYAVENSGNNPGLPPDGTRYEFATDVPSGLRAGGGMTLRFVGMGLTGEYTTGSYNTVSLKAGLSIN